MLLGAGGWSGHGHQDRVGEGRLSGREFAGQVLSCREVSVAVGVGVIPAWGQCVQRPCGMRGVFEEVGDRCGSAGKRRECKRGAGARGFALCEATYSGAWGLPPGMWVPPVSCQPGLEFGMCGAQGRHRCPRGRGPSVSTMRFCTQSGTDPWECGTACCLPFFWPRGIKRGSSVSC